MKKIIFSLIVMTLILGTFFLFNCNSDDPNVIKIGGVFAVTGNAGPLGEPELKTARMLVEQINAKGGIKFKENGKEFQKKIKLYDYDTASDNEQCLKRVEKLIHNDKVLAIVGPTQSGETMIILPIIQQAGIPLLSCAASIQIVDPVNKWVFKTPQSDSTVVEKIIEYLQFLKIDSVGIITATSNFGKSGRKELVKLFGANKINIVIDEVFGLNDQSVEAQVLNLKTKNAKAVIVWDINDGSAKVVKAIKDAGLTIPIICSHGIANKKFITLLDKLSDGVVFPSGRLPVVDFIDDSNTQKKTLLEYRSQFQAKYNVEPNTFGGHAWDSVMLLVKAIEEVGTDKNKIVEYLETIQGFVGISGIFNFSKTDHCGLSKDSLEFVKIVNGKWELLKL